MVVPIVPRASRSWDPCDAPRCIELLPPWTWWLACSLAPRWPAPGIAARAVNVIIKQLVARRPPFAGAPRGWPCEASPSPFPEPPHVDSIAFGCIPADRFDICLPPALPVQLISRIITRSAGQLKKS